MASRSREVSAVPAHADSRTQITQFGTTYLGGLKIETGAHSGGYGRCHAGTSRYRV